MIKYFLFLLLIAQVAIGYSVVYYKAPAVGGGGATNKAAALPGCSAANCADLSSGSPYTDYIKVGNINNNQNIFDWNNSIGWIAIRAKAISWPAGDFNIVLGATDTGWSRGVNMNKMGTNLRFWVNHWSGSGGGAYSERPLPTAGNWFVAIGRFKKGGNVDFCVDGTDGTPDSLTADISSNTSDTTTLEMRIGSSAASGFGKGVNLNVSEVAMGGQDINDTVWHAGCNATATDFATAMGITPTVQYKIDSNDTPTAVDGFADSGSSNFAGDGAANITLTTDAF